MYMHSPLNPLSVWMSVSRQSTLLNRLAPFSTRSARAAVSSDWSENERKLVTFNIVDTHSHLDSV